MSIADFRCGWLLTGKGRCTASDRTILIISSRDISSSFLNLRLHRSPHWGNITQIVYSITSPGFILSLSILLGWLYARRLTGDVVDFTDYGIDTVVLTLTASPSADTVRGTVVIPNR